MVSQCSRHAPLASAAFRPERSGQPAQAAAQPGTGAAGLGNGASAIPVLKGPFIRSAPIVRAGVPLLACPAVLLLKPQVSNLKSLSRVAQGRAACLGRAATRGLSRTVVARAASQQRSLLSLRDTDTVRATHANSSPASLPSPWLTFPLTDVHYYVQNNGRPYSNLTSLEVQPCLVVTDA